MNAWMNYQKHGWLIEWLGFIEIMNECMFEWLNDWIMKVYRIDYWNSEWMIDSWKRP